uniref:Tripartite motif-containing protein 65 n=1 Tax=Pyxicephalus adspersus TaxID=30357 RepID=A0AAV3AKH3_PYXAD|nr:TPA: hypothetical protein GDO54_008308 [Pyxicephalus adspersus]
MSETLKFFDALKNSLCCSICLDLFTNPLSLPCGHTFCQTCIHGHWDSQNPQRDTFSCPDCRLVFTQRPEPQKNVSIQGVLDLLKKQNLRTILGASKDSGPKDAKIICPEHNQELTFYCRTEKRCLCYKCMLKSCRNHNIEDIEEQSEKEREKLSSDVEANKQQKEDIEKQIEDWKQKSQSIEEFHNTLVSRVMTKFDQVQNTLEKCQALVVESVRCEEKAALAKVSDHLQHLQKHLQDLNKYHSDAEQLLDTKTSDAEFLQGLLLLTSVGDVPVAPDVEVCGTVQMEAVTKVLPEVTRLLQEELPNALHPEKIQLGTGASSSFPDQLKTELNTNPTTMSFIRTKLYEDYRNLTFDPETANRYIEISHQDCKATHKTSLRHNNVPESPMRFKTWQVMCKEGFLDGSHYWEVEISIFFVRIGVAYGSLKRTNESENNIGRNNCSWSLELRSMGQSVWHGNQEVALIAQKYRKIGVHLDCVAGSVTFYGIKNGDLECLHIFHSVFSERLYPVFWIGEDVSVKLHQVKKTPGDDVAV